MEVIKKYKLKANMCLEVETINTSTNSRHRKAYSPGEDLSSEPEAIQAVGNEVWTQEVIDKYNQERNDLV